MTMFDIGTELENASVAMRRADDIWEIFLEDMEQDLEQMDDNDSWVQYMRKRFGRAKSLLEAAILQQGEGCGLPSACSQKFLGKTGFLYRSIFDYQMRGKTKGKNT